MFDPELTRFSDTEIASALRVTGGNYTAAARVLAEANAEIVTRAHVFRRVNGNPLLMELVADLRNELLDTAESNICQSVLAGNREDSKFVLQTIGRSRGYVRKIETESATETELLRRIQEGRERSMRLHEDNANAAALTLPSTRIEEAQIVE